MTYVVQARNPIIGPRLSLKDKLAQSRLHTYSIETPIGGVNIVTPLDNAILSTLRPFGFTPGLAIRSRDAVVVINPQAPERPRRMTEFFQRTLNDVQLKSIVVVPIVNFLIDKIPHSTHPSRAKVANLLPVLLLISNIGEAESLSFIYGLPYSDLPYSRKDMRFRISPNQLTEFIHCTHNEKDVTYRSLLWIYTQIVKGIEKIAGVSSE